ncbi:P-loop containing nucleoside triphosphate hydrolase protein [Lasiosphaeria hispida]|uniref:P-loop containing nucleoside triphosphate hydrolase protein n=1 Tax=Lasiosphaeria hispida TaxID=260671 RepID=A0AAJ0HCC6_9PEZI|nr:P-loop containing nucleoside triphosphate hydrolase protein [Lasiosphaeria hispida]
MDRVWDLFHPTQAGLFNALDELSNHKVANEIDIPQLVVVGDQSSGKSSVLEAIIREKFPVAEGLCTRFPTKLIYRRSDTKRCRVRIEPGRSRTDDERRALQQFSAAEFDDDDLQLDVLVRNAAIKLGVNLNASSALATRPGARDFSDDVLVIEKHGPELPLVTLVDLPGLFVSQTTEQGEEGKETVARMVKEYIGSRRSITILVINARIPYANQGAPSVVQEILGEDPGLASRLVGVITNPDHPGVDTDDITKLLKGTLSQLHPKGGWHVVRNDNKYERKGRLRIEERDVREAEFFGKDDFWQTVPAEQKGIKALLVALRRMLQAHIRAELPGIIREVWSKAAIIEGRLDDISRSRATVEDRREYLSVIAEKFEHLTREAADGTYRDVECIKPHDVGAACSGCTGFFSGFGDNPPEGQDKRLRSNVRMLGRAFAASMRQYGKTETVMDDAGASEGIDLSPDKTPAAQIYMVDAFPYQDIINKYYSYPNPEYVSRKDHERMVAENIERWRGLEPNEEASPTVCWGLLEYQSKLWPKIAENHLCAVWEVTNTFIEKALAASCPDEEVLLLLREHLIDDVLADLRASSKKTLRDLLKCRRRGNTGFYDGFADILASLRRAKTQSIRQANHRAQNTDSAPSDDLVKGICDAVGSLPVPFADLGGALLDGTIQGPALGKISSILWQFLRLDAGSGNADVLHQNIVDPSTGPAAPVTLAPARVIDQEEAYYEICMASFIGYVNTLVVGGRILDELPTAVFSQRIVRRADKAKINIIAGEKEDDTKRREEDQRGLVSLQRILKTLQGYERRQVPEGSRPEEPTADTDSGLEVRSNSILTDFSHFSL